MRVQHEGAINSILLGKPAVEGQIYDLDTLRDRSDSNLQRIYYNYVAMTLLYITMSVQHAASFNVIPNKSN